MGYLTFSLEKAHLHLKTNLDIFLLIKLIGNWTSCLFVKEKNEFA